MADAAYYRFHKWVAQPPDVWTDGLPPLHTIARGYFSSSCLAFSAPLQSEPDALRAFWWTSITVLFLLIIQYVLLVVTDFNAFPDCYLPNYGFS